MLFKNPRKDKQYIIMKDNYIIFNGNIFQKKRYFFILFTKKNSFILTQ